MQTRADGLAWTMQTTADGLARAMQTTVQQKVGQAMQTRADGLAWTMQTRTRRLDRPCRLEQTRVEQKVGYLCRVWLKC